MEEINIQFTEQKADPKIIKNFIDFRLSDLQKRSKTLQRLTSLKSIKSKLKNKKIIEDYFILLYRTEEKKCRRFILK